MLRDDPRCGCSTVDADGVDGTVALLRPLLIDRMGRIEREAIGADVGHIAMVLQELLGAVVALLTERLKFTEPELIPIAAMRFDMVGNACQRSSSSGQAEPTQRFHTQLMLGALTMAFIGIPPPWIVIGL
jgi:hypothetical protein